MNRRSALVSIAAAIGTCVRPSIGRAQAPAWPPCTVYGDRSRPVVLCVNAQTRIDGTTATALLDRYCVASVDLEPPGIPPEQHTADGVCAAILSAATAAGIPRFAWYGFSFGAVVGLQLATRTDRLTGLICGGWPPLGAQYAETLAFVDAQVAKGLPIAHTQTFYRSIRNWPERDAVAALTVPRAAFAGSDDQFVAGGQRIHIAETLTQNRDELERLGWRVELVPGFRHDLGGRLDVVLPLVRRFLDRA